MTVTSDIVYSVLAGINFGIIMAFIYTIGYNNSLIERSRRRVVSVPSFHWYSCIARERNYDVGDVGNHIKVTSKNVDTVVDNLIKHKEKERASFKEWQYENR